MHKLDIVPTISDASNPAASPSVPLPDTDDRTKLKTPAELRITIEKYMGRIKDHLNDFLGTFEKYREKNTPLINSVLEVSRSHVNLLVEQYEQLRAADWHMLEDIVLHQQLSEMTDRFLSSVNQCTAVWDRLKARVVELTSDGDKPKKSSSTDTAYQNKDFNAAHHLFKRLASHVKKQRNTYENENIPGTELFREHASTRKQLAAHINVHDPLIGEILAITMTRNGDFSSMNLQGTAGGSQLNGKITENAGNGSQGNAFTARLTRRNEQSSLMRFLNVFQARVEGDITEKNGFTSSEIALIRETLLQGLSGVLTRINTERPDITLLDIHKGLFLRKVKQSFDLIGEDLDKQKVIGPIFTVLAFGVRVFGKKYYESLLGPDKKAAATPPEQS